MAENGSIIAKIGIFAILLILATAQTDPPLCTSIANIDASMTPVDLPSFREDISFTWVAPNYTSVFAMTTTGYVYFSPTSGRDWTTQSVDEIMPGSEEHGVLSMSDTADPSKYVFLGGDGIVWFCTIGADGIPTYRLVDMTLVDAKHIGGVAYLHPHPNKGDWLLLSTRSRGCITQSEDCYISVFLTQDFGSSWQLLETYVRAFAWGSRAKGVSDESIMVVYYEDKSGNQAQKSPWNTVLATSNDLWKHKTAVLSHVIGAWILADTVFAPQLLAASGRSAQLMVSTDFGRTFHRAALPSDMDEATKFYVLDSSQGSAVLAVDVSPDDIDLDYADLYVSDRYDNEFSLSLSGVVKNGAAIDVHNLGNIDGIYVANTYSADTLENPTSNPQILSRITFDKGGSWQPLTPPAGAACWSPEGGKGGSTSSTDGAPCSLHLYNVATSPTRQNWMVYSPPSTAGIVVANGNAGSALAPPANAALGTYLSRDAGMTWEQVANETRVFKMADHGALLVTATVPAPTNQVQFSWDQGLSFTECAFTDMTPGLRVKDIVKSPAIGQFAVLLYGTLPNGQYSGNAQGYVVLLDFSRLVTQECRNPDSPDSPDSDYETFYPSDTRGGKCLLGQETVYVRKKRTVQCYNPSDYEVKRAVRRCPCTREDYECDYCFTPNPQVQGECIPDTTDPKCLDYKPSKSKPLDCKDVWYPHSKGYRLVAGDVCDVQKGLNLLGDPEPCNPSSSGSSSRGAVIAVIVVLVVLCGAAVGFFVLYRKNEAVRRWVDAKVTAIMAKFRGSSGSDGHHYQMVGVINDDDPLGVIESTPASSISTPTTPPTPAEGTSGGSLI